MVSDSETNLDSLSFPKFYGLIILEAIGICLGPLNGGFFIHYVWHSVFSIMVCLEFSVYDYVTQMSCL